MHTTSQTVALMEKDPAVKSIEYDCLQTPLATYPGAPWGLDRIDGVDDNSYNDGDLTGGGTGVRVYVVDTGVQGTHQDFGGRVVSGHTVGTLAHALSARATLLTLTGPCIPGFPRLSGGCAPRVRLVPSGQRHPPRGRHWMRRSRHPRGLDRRRLRLRRREERDAGSGFLVLQVPMLGRNVQVWIDCRYPRKPRVRCPTARSRSPRCPPPTHAHTQRLPP